LGNNRLIVTRVLFQGGRTLYTIVHYLIRYFKITSKVGKKQNWRIEYRLVSLQSEILFPFVIIYASANKMNLTKDDIQ